MEAKVCVLMPVHNAEDTIVDVINSILQQTFQDYTVLIIDDASIDNTPVILSKFKGQKVNILRLNERIGIVNALNWSLGEVNEPYIIRADPRVISKPDRFETLVSFLDKNTEIGVCGSIIKSPKKNVDIPFALTHEDISAQMLFQNPIQRGTMIFRTAILQEKGYRLRDKYKYMEDYDLWYRLRNETRFANLYIPLVESNQPLTDRKTPAYKEYRAEAVTFYLEKLLDFGIKPTDKELKLHLDFSDLSKPKKLGSPLAYHQWLNKLHLHNLQVKAFPDKEFKNFLDYKWAELFHYILQKSNKKISSYLRAEGKTSLQIFRYIFMLRFRQLFGLHK